MSRTIKGKKQDSEFWSKRPGIGGHGKVGKKITHRIERQRNKEDAKKAPWTYEIKD